MSETLRNKLVSISENDTEVLINKDAEYGSSWKRRGGIGAFMMLARKWDRLEEQVKKHSYDIFAAIKADSREEGIIDDLRDLRRYGLLIESETVETKISNVEPAPVVDWYDDGVEKKVPVIRNTTNHPAPFGYPGEE